MSLGQELAPHLPFLRRYARALTGSQAHGDAFVRATLEAIVAEPDEFPRDVDPRLGLYRTFHAIWSTANIEEGEEPSRSFAGSEGIGFLWAMPLSLLVQIAVGMLASLLPIGRRQEALRVR